MQRIANIGGYEGQVGRFRPEQIANQESWAVVPDSDTALAAITRVTVVPENASTCTYVNPLDPGDGGDTDWYAPDDTGWDTVVRARRMF